MYQNHEIFYLAIKIHTNNIYSQFLQNITTFLQNIAY